MGLIEVKLRPVSPWRAGHRAGDRERVDVVYHSDALYSAITHAMLSLGWLDSWLDATARGTGPSAARFSSLFPFIGKTRLIAPPLSAPALSSVTLIPLELARGGAFDKSRWQADIPSSCLLPAGSHPPFQVSVRSAAAVDRLTGAVEPHRMACLEFAGNAGMWGVFEATEEWEPKIKSAFRLLADSGFGGEKSRGWGRSSDPVFSTATALFPDRTPNGAWWLLSLFSPHAEDQIDWTKGRHSVSVRGGWTDSPAGTGVKKQVRMIEEGAVLSAPDLRGRAVDVAPDHFPHPVYRSGIALAMPLPEPKPVAPIPAPEALLPPPEPETEIAPAEPELPPQPEVEPEPAEPELPTESDAEPAPAEPELPSQPQPEPEPELLPHREAEAALPQTEPEPLQPAPEPAPQIAPAEPELPPHPEIAHDAAEPELPPQPVSEPASPPPAEPHVDVEPKE